MVFGLMLNLRRIETIYILMSEGMVLFDVAISVAEVGRKGTEDVHSSHVLAAKGAGTLARTNPYASRVFILPLVQH